MRSSPRPTAGTGTPRTQALDADDTLGVAQWELCVKITQFMGVYFVPYRSPVAFCNGLFLCPDGCFALIDCAEVMGGGRKWWHGSRNLER